MTGDQSEIGLVRTEKSSTIIAEPSAPRPDAQNRATNTLRAMSMTMAGLLAHLRMRCKNTTPRARGGVTMAPLQLRLEPTEVVSAMNKGAARVRVDSTDESSLQV
eukprot:scaffold6931_cov119-Isochrysis_galbana.AAC.15